MRRGSTLAGLGGIAFAVLTLLAFLIVSPAGGSYKASDVADYVAKGHRVAVVIGTYLAVIGIAGLIALLARLRAMAFAGGGEDTDRIFWGAGIAAAATMASGWGIVVGPPFSRLFGGSGTEIGTSVVYTIAETGDVLLFIVGPILLGIALLALVASGGATLPAWLRWATLVAAIAALASTAFFPFFLVLIWALAVGIWLLVSGRAEPPAAATTMS